MKTWKSKKVSPKHDVWVSEVRLGETDAVRTAKVRRLFNLLKEVHSEDIS